MDIGREEGIQQGIVQSIGGAVKALRKFAKNEAEIKGVIMEQYNITAEEAEKYRQEVK